MDFGLNSSFKFLDTFIAQAISSRDRSHFNVKDKIFFFRELAYLIDGGVPLYDAVMLIYNTSDNYALKDICYTIAHLLNNGKNFSYSLARNYEFFDEGDVMIVKSGEKGGNLSEVLFALAKEYQFVNALKNKYYGAMLYPMILMGVTVIALIAMFYFILPGIFDIVLSFDNIEIPWYTATLMGITAWLNVYGHVVGWTFIGIVGVISFLIVSGIGSKKIIEIVMNMPMIGAITKYYFLIKFCRYAKMMLVAGMNYVDTFKLLQGILDIPVYQQFFDDLIGGLIRGKTIYQSIKHHSELIPSSVIMLFKVGEETANLQQAMDNVVMMYEEELDTVLTSTSKLIEPLMIIFIGFVVVAIALSVFGVIGNILGSVGV